MAKNYWEKCPILPPIRKLSTKTTLRYCLTPGIVTSSTTLTTNGGGDVRERNTYSLLVSSADQ